MSVLVDTHVAIWWLTDDATLSEDIKNMLDLDTEVFLSPVTIWEVTIKQMIGKLEEPHDLAERIRDSGFEELPVTIEHALTAGRLPLIHRDPFDRMLVAQAHCEGLTLVSRDRDIQQYGVPFLRA